MAAETMAQTADNKSKLLRKPNAFLWTATLLVIIYAVSIDLTIRPELIYFCFEFQ